MKTKLNLKTALYVILLAAGCAQAQECSDSKSNLTVTDVNGQVLMTNASYTCAYQGRLFFGRGCQVEGFAAESINPALLSRRGLDLKDIEAKGRADVQKKEESDRAYQRYTQNSIARKAIEDERAARRAEAEAARRAEREQAAREEMLALNSMNLATGAVPAAQWGQPGQVWGSSVAVAYPGYDERWGHSSYAHRHHPEDVRENEASKSAATDRGTIAASNNGRTLPTQAPRANPQGNPGGNQQPKNVGEKGASRPVAIHHGIVATPNNRHNLPSPAPRTNPKGNAGGHRKAFSRPAPSIHR
jgi:hypothetical protein